jgi:exonuclease SbcD
MKIIHISDTHLGAAGFSRKLSAFGTNQREEDFCDSFAYAIDKIIQLKPDMVLHTGDFFHSVRPTNRIINLALKQILRITELKIPVVLISGNHDTPKQKGVGSVFSIFEFFPNIFPIHQNRYEFLTLNQVAIHAIPHCLDIQVFKDELSKIKLDEKAKYNILLLHGVVAGIKEFSMGELSEQEIPSSILEMGFDYVALGHYHNFTQVRDKIFYAGSTERLSMAELGKEKGFVEIDLDKSKVDFHSVPTRDMIELEPIDALGLDAEGVYQEIKKRIEEKEISEKIIRLRIRNIPNYIYSSLPFTQINELKKESFHFDLRIERKEEKKETFAQSTSIGKLSQEFSSYIREVNVGELEKNRIVELGLKYLEQTNKLE